jgi:hypothetical protein
MRLATELDLPTLDHSQPALQGERFRIEMAALYGHDGWLAANPFGFTVLDRQSASSSCAHGTRCSPG